MEEWREKRQWKVMGASRAPVPAAARREWRRPNRIPQPALAALSKGDDAN